MWLAYNISHQSCIFSPIPLFNCEDNFSFFIFTGENCVQKNLTCLTGGIVKLFTVLQKILRSITFLVTYAYFNMKLLLLPNCICLEYFMVFDWIIVMAHPFMLLR